VAAALSGDATQTQLIISPTREKERRANKSDSFSWRADDFLSFLHRAHDTHEAWRVFKKSFNFIL